MSVRRAVIIAMTTVGVLALSAAVCLAIVTDYLSATVSVLTSNVESVRAAQQIELDLFLHSQARSPITRTMLENDVLDGLRRVRQYVTSGEEAAAISKAEQDVTFYFYSPEDGATSTVEGSGVDLALGAVRKVADLNVAQARLVEAEATRWDRLADRIGFAVVLIIVLTVPAILTWVGMFAFRPMFAILGTMKNFASGDMRATVPPTTGIEELRTLGEQLNEMIAAIRRQRQNQLAFLAGVSHDLRNPINALNMSVAVLTGEGPLPSEDQIRKTLAIVKRQIEFLNRMVGDLHDADQLHAGKLNLRQEHCDANALFANVCELFTAVSGSHRLTLNSPPNQIFVWGDPIRLRQVLNNLVNNAIKYSPAGGEILLNLRESATDVIFEISDCGIGIPADELAHIFEPFRRTKLSKEAIPGTGLGLYISRQIVDAHHGRIEIESEIGAGSTFRVRLPRDPRCID